MTKKQGKKTEYFGGKVKQLVEQVARMVARDPSLANINNYDRLHAEIARSVENGISFPGYSDPGTCFNCSRSMKIQVYTAGIGHALLLLAMAKAVREETRKGMEFTKANRTHIDRLPIETSIKKQQSQLGYLGLIKPVASARSGYWLITSWGWKALRGEKIPKAVKYWNGKLIARSEEETTLWDMMQTHREKIEKQIRLGKKVKMMDHRSEISEYDSVQWAEYAGVIDERTLFTIENGTTKAIVHAPDCRISRSACCDEKIDSAGVCGLCRMKCHRQPCSCRKS